jgi:hypothetical protein
LVNGVGFNVIGSFGAAKGLANAQAEGLVPPKPKEKVQVSGELGRANEKQMLADLGKEKNNDLWRPDEKDINSAAFKMIVGEPKKTSSGELVGTIFDATEGGNFEIKGGSSPLESRYQLRLQVYRSLKEGTPLTLVTSRPINPTFQDWLTRWGVQVQTPK